MSEENSSEREERTGGWEDWCGECWEQMVPYCLTMILPNVPKEKRVDFALDTIDSLVEQGSAGMSSEEKADFVAKIVERVGA